MAWGAQTGKRADKIPQMDPMGCHTPADIKRHEKGKGREDSREQKDSKGRDLGSQGKIWSGTKKTRWFD